MPRNCVLIRMLNRQQIRRSVKGQLSFSVTSFFVGGIKWTGQKRLRIRGFPTGAAKRLVQANIEPWSVGKSLNVCLYSWKKDYAWRTKDHSICHQWSGERECYFPVEQIHLNLQKYALSARIWSVWTVNSNARTFICYLWLTNTLRNGQVWLRACEYIWYLRYFNITHTKGALIATFTAKCCHVITICTPSEQQSPL